MPSTIKSAKSCHPLAAAVLRQLGGGKDAIEYAKDAANHGADSGLPGFTMTAECVAFYKRNKLAIYRALKEHADSSGEPMAAVLLSFRCLRGVEDPLGALMMGCRSDDYDTVANALAWFALEEVGHAIIRDEEG